MFVTVFFQEVVYAHSFRECYGAFSFSCLSVDLYVDEFAVDDSLFCLVEVELCPVYFHYLGVWCCPVRVHESEFLETVHLENLGALLLVHDRFSFLFFRS